ncbi:LacI family DNA-binding transcriptional regulator [Paenibacillus alginolyticus]|uniref:LacI family transcriptional regulator n=1 Tax=Paenibacillus alginolyticus TaxID=59839 RepID=A0ABT4GBU2_9BACL|nr:LacI family DNA-binding transcriptional regulator [Paenibacillus alginolyticus]MCY9693594.1 LacI family transcriptional regulator [Paenibacillus alginolyticus]MEC0146655.1 LacI family DNA-binding transcriptional regulator [Paenibacillus alginolyticus]
MKFKIIDVATRAGVAPATVSRVLNDSSKVTPKTRDKVMKIINELGYQPNAAAKNLRSQKTMTIGVIVPDISNSYFSEVIKGIENIAYSKKYKVVICDTENNEEKELEFLNLLTTRTIDGVIMVAPMLANEVILQIADNGYAIGIVGKQIDHDRIPCIVTDNVKFSMKVISHLVELGHREIAFINGSAHAVDSYDRLEGYLKALREHHIPFRPELIEIGNFNETGGYEAIHRLFAKKIPFTAVYSANDEMALGVYRACSELGIQIPMQLAVVGVDNNRISKYITPPLSTVNQPKYTMGALLVEKLIDMMNENEYAENRVFKVDSELLIRGSSDFKKNGQESLK